MAMEVTVEDQSALLMDLFDEPFAVKNSRVQGLVGRLPTTIQITTG